MMPSPCQRQVNRRKLHKTTGIATAQALKAAAEHANNRERRRFDILGRRLEACAVSSHFKIINTPGEASYVRFSNKRTCRSSLCFSCSAHRARKAVANVLTVIDRIRTDRPQIRFAFLTLTSRNRPVAETKAMFDRHEAALTRFWRLAPVKSAFLGHITSIETTLSRTDEGVHAHVHSHSILALHPNYFDRQHTLYLNQARIVDLWKRCLRADYKPICDIRPISADAAAVREAVKYAIAPHEFSLREGSTITVEPDVVAALVRALYRRRLVRSSGLFTRPRMKRRERRK